MPRLWQKFNGEPFLINPHLISLNPKRSLKMARRKTPRRGAGGRFLKASHSRPQKRRTIKMSGYLANPQRRHTSRRGAAPRKNAYFGNPRRSRRRIARRNPPMFGGNRIMGLSVNELLYTGVGFIVPPAVEGFAKGFLPATLTSTPLGRYGLKVGTVALLSMAGNKFLGREAGKYIAIGGATYIIANLVIDFMPTLFSGFAGYMNPGQTTPARALRGGPFLGMYSGIGTSPAKLPERVDPNSRF